MLKYFDIQDRKKSMILCKICNKEFPNMITWKHLKTHNISVRDYKNIYGDIVTEDYRKLKSVQSSGTNNPMFGKSHDEQTKNKISAATKGRIPFNKNMPMSDKQKKLLSDNAVKRNKQWRENSNHPLLGRKHSDDTIKKIKEKRAKQTIKKSSIQKALETKVSKGYDLAIFRGKTHSAESKQKISKSSKINAEKKSNQSLIECTNRLNQYNYSLISHDKNIINIKCNKCNTFFSRTKQYAYASKVNEEMCPTCFPPLKGDSKAQQELQEFLKKHVQIQIKDRSTIAPKELDILIPQHRLAVEYNGLYWHSELFKHSSYHLDKTNSAKEKGIKLIHIFEDEWINCQEIVKSRLLSAINISNHKIYARNCVIKEINSKTANNFLNKNHIQGSGRSNVRVGLFYNDELVSVMTFLKGDISKNIRDWELNRFCSKLYTSVIGAASKLFNYFIKTYHPTQIVSFSDKRWSSDKTVYEKLNFVHVHDSPPNYWYFHLNTTKRYHRYSLRKTKKSLLSEKELRKSQNYLRIYDCGSSKWLWKNKSGN